jgi:hypothetical protein
MKRVDDRRHARRRLESLARRLAAAYSRLPRSEGVAEIERAANAARKRPRPP